MNSASLSAKKFAIMVAHGFEEESFIAIQRAMMHVAAQLKVVSPSGGLANGRSASGTGMSYPVDAQLSETLAIDYDGLIIPAGDIHLDKLADEPHALRIIRAFLREKMPILVVGSAGDLLAKVSDDMPHPDLETDSAMRAGQLVKAAHAGSIGEAMRLLAEAVAEAAAQSEAA